MANENRYFKTPFAESGDRLEVPDASVAGAVGFDTGFGPDYELPQGSVNKKRIERDKYNGLHHSITKNLKQWQEHLYPTWIEDAGTGTPFSYPAGMIVNHAGKNWVSNDATNTEEPGVGIKWSVHFDDWMAFTAALYADAGITPNGLPDTATASQRLDALKKISGRRLTTVSEIATGVFKAGDKLIVTDRNDAPFKIISGIANGYNKLDGLGGLIAIYSPAGAADMRAYGIGEGGDDTAALQEFVSNESDWIGDAGLVIRPTSNVTIPVKPKLTANMNGATILHTTGFVPLTNANTVTYTGTITGEVTRQSHTINMTSAAVAANFVKGDLVQIRSQTLWYYDNRGTAKKGETHIVASVSGATITTEAAIFDTYEAAETLTLVKIDKSDYQISGLNIVGVAGLDGGCQFNGLANSNVKININGSRVIGLFLKNCYQTNGAGYFKNVTDSGTGYGVQISQSTFTHVINSEFWNNRRGVDISGADAVSRMCIIGYNRNYGVSDTLYNVSSGFGTHGSSDGTQMIANQVWSCKQAFITRGSNEAIDGNFGFGSMIDFAASTDGAALTITNNTYRSSAVLGSPASGDSRLLNFANITMHDNRGRTVIKNNFADRLVTSFMQINVKTGSDNTNVRGIFSTDNNWSIYANSQGASFTKFLFVAAGGFTSCVLKGCEFKDNIAASIFGGQIINYDPLLNMYIGGGLGANIVDGLKLTLVDANANTTGLTQNVFADISSQSVSIYGRVAFSTAAAGGVRFSGFPSQRLSQNIGFIQNDYGIGAVSVAYNGTSGSNGMFLLAINPALPDGNFAIGSHSIMLNFTYEQDIERYIR